MGLIILSIWTFGTIVYGFSRKDSLRKRKEIWEGLANKIRISSPRSAHWKKLLITTVIAIYAFVFMEWLFFATKPSFMDIMSWGEKVEIYFLTSFWLSVIGIILILILAGIDYALIYFKISLPIPLIGLLIPSLIFLVLVFLMADNFTYTIFNFGVVSTGGIWRGIYAFILVVFFIELYVKLYEILDFGGNKKTKSNFKTPFIIFGGITFVSLAITFTQPILFTNMIGDENDGVAHQTAKRPNIILLGSDGLNAQNLSVYGYDRETTPRIKELASTSKIVENAFPNAGNSAGSVISILTSKLPTQTRLSYPPDILKGNDAFQHLPAILKSEGYYNIEYAVPHYVDSFTMNMQNGFDIVNGRSDLTDSPFRFLNKFGYHDLSYFLSLLKGRIEERLLHIFYIEKMLHPYKIVTQPGNDQVSQDREKIDQLLDAVINSERPVFVHVHLMGTHGPKFFPSQRVYSIGETQNEDWLIDFYDNSILEFDRYVGEVIDNLKDAGEWDNTILIIYSDHAQKYDVNVRIPLLFHFPGDENGGIIKPNVQNLDISPTILDYLDIPIPEWMEGQSLLHSGPQNQRLIFSTKIVEQITENQGYWILDVNRLSPPFYQFGKIFVMDCHIWHMVNLEQMEWESGEVIGHTSPCQSSELLTHDHIKREVIEHLDQEGFDTTTIP